VIAVPLILRKPAQKMVQDPTLPQKNPELDVSCALAPQPCVPDMDTCKKCGDQWSCQTIKESENLYGLSGSFCLLSHPTSLCSTTSTDSNNRIPGQLRWLGWGGVEVQDWECTCPFSRFYPMDINSGGCVRSAEVCAGGTWTYPCVRDAVGGCSPLTDQEKQSYIGSDMFSFGHCECPPGQRVKLDEHTGVPKCVQDQCKTGLPCTDVCPGTQTCVQNMCVGGCVADEDCGDAGQCENGVCLWGKWQPNNVAPYLFGQCVCPIGCSGVGDFCVCN